MTDFSCRCTFFYPITTRIYGGSNRKSNNQNWAYGYDVVITSYGIARIDCHFLSQTFWNYIILDEAHTIKNPSTETAKAMKIIPAKHRLALTGTPIQNSPDELWALFDFLMPKYLKSREKFREEYTSNLRQNSSNFNETAEKLKSRIHPFILRRLKEDVAKDLPEKIQIERPVELSKKQVALYKQFTKSEDFRKLEDEIDKKGVKRSGIMILQIYSALRNLCNHPNIITHPQDYLRDPKLQDSGKLEMLKELLEEIESGGHRALLFCQSTRMLDIIEYFYKQWNYNYLRLDGSTSQGSRSKYVDEFNENKNILCFLISTKAGGTGLNLTGADTVIFYDHDWNPANDKQAQDRAYRIGQTKNVSVYKLVSKGTIEEKIINRQIIKSKVAEAIIQADPEGFKDISKEDLLNLFKLDEE